MSCTCEAKHEHTKVCPAFMRRYNIIRVVTPRSLIEQPRSIPEADAEQARREQIVQSQMSQTDRNGHYLSVLSQSQ
jgi:hypothetical protein